MPTVYACKFLVAFIWCLCKKYESFKIPRHYFYVWYICIKYSYLVEQVEVLLSQFEWKSSPLRHGSRTAIEAQILCHLCPRTVLHMVCVSPLCVCINIIICVICVCGYCDIHRYVVLPYNWLYMEPFAYILIYHSIITSCIIMSSYVIFGYIRSSFCALHQSLRQCQCVTRGASSRSRETSMSGCSQCELPHLI